MHRGSPLAVKASMFGKKKQMKRKMRWALIPQFAPLTEKDRKKLVGGAAVKTTHDVVRESVLVDGYTAVTVYVV
jgi:hypothetical protein